MLKATLRMALVSVVLAAVLALPGLRLTRGALSFGPAVHTALACDPASSSSCGG